jgi:hypothetical protein
MRPKTRIEFDEIIPMSAKFSRPTVLNVKEKIRDWLDRQQDRSLKIAMDTKAQELARLNTDSGPTVI